MCTPSASKHSTIYNPTVRPSPAANHSAFFDYSADKNKQQKLHYVYALWGSYSQDLYDVLKRSAGCGVMVRMQFIKDVKDCWVVDITNLMHYCNLALNFIEEGFEWSFMLHYVLNCIHYG